MYVIVKPGNDIYHHGIKGQKWGIRRYEERRNKIYSKLTNSEKKNLIDAENKYKDTYNNRTRLKDVGKAYGEYYDSYKDLWKSWLKNGTLSEEYLNSYGNFGHKEFMVRYKLSRVIMDMEKGMHDRKLLNKTLRNLEKKEKKMDKRLKAYNNMTPLEKDDYFSGIVSDITLKSQINKGNKSKYKKLIKENREKLDNLVETSLRRNKTNDEPFEYDKLFRDEKMHREY